MRKKLDILFVVDCSKDAGFERYRINAILNDFVYSLKTLPDLHGFDISISLVPFSDEIHREEAFEFKSLKNISSEIKLDEFCGSSNPGPAIFDITERALQRYENWRAEGCGCYHPVLYFFSGNLCESSELKKEYVSAYEKVAEYIKEKEEEKKLRVFPVAVEHRSTYNLNLLTNHEEHIHVFGTYPYDVYKKKIDSLIEQAYVWGISPYFDGKNITKLKDVFKMFDEDE